MVSDDDGKKGYIHYIGRGKSSRMGTDKALLPIGEKTIIEYVYNSLLPVSSEIIISSNTNSYCFLNAKIVRDKYINIGPIGGIYSCLKESTNEINLIVSCDTPLLTPDFYRYILSLHNDFEVTNPVHNDITEPIIGVFNKKIVGQIEYFIKQKVYSPPKIFAAVKQQFINIDSSLPFYDDILFLSINAPEDYKLISKRFR